ncbi:hypothetical protein KUTeg_015163 [Tegillarca granosa]|uniref:Xylulose kinase n=1 Tax=Tegillarca granosa TaxID=220873 RepID=A0ABQ9EQ07_TEGGR|nr:hypothetical protein KUTeg_015163 [Tegillarca granosa]
MSKTHGNHGRNYIKVTAVYDDLQMIYESAVKFDTDLPEFKTHGGAHIHDDQVTVTAPTTMWIKAFNISPKALEMLLNRMQNGGFDFSKVKCVSGAGQRKDKLKLPMIVIVCILIVAFQLFQQQHGSVYWKKGAREKLKNELLLYSLYDQLKDCFSIPDSPIWMDASTTAQCKKLEEAVGGAMRLAEITGARAFERYTGTQIMKISENNTEAYNNTERISLVSSFAASLFLGDYAPIDYSDGSGMNLFDITKHTWSPECLQACGDDLANKLGEPVPSPKILGNISEYLVMKYNFPKDCKVVAFTGTSDSVFKNGSLTRERIKDKCAEGSWDRFAELLQSTPMGNNGNIEIQPLVSGDYRFNDKNQQVDSFPPETEVRAVIEGQFMARRMYAELRGMKTDPNTRIIATGGASINKSILQVMSDVFNAPVYITDVANSASLGGCYRAKHGLTGQKFEEVVKGHPEPICVAKPTPGAEQLWS